MISPASPRSPGSTPNPVVPHATTTSRSNRIPNVASRLLPNEEPGASPTTSVLNRIRDKFWTVLDQPSIMSLLNEAKEKFWAAVALTSLKIISLFDRVKSFFYKPTQGNPDSAPSQAATPTEIALVEERKPITDFHNLPVSRQEQDTLDRLLERLSTAGPIDLFLLVSDKFRIEQELKSIHPLKSLEHMLKSRSGINHLRSLKEKSLGLIWSAFTSDIGEKLQIQHNKAQIVRFIDAFSRTLGLEETDSPLPTSSYEWNEWVKKIIQQKIDNCDTQSQHSNSSGSNPGTATLAQIAENQEPEDFCIDKLAAENLSKVLQHFAKSWPIRFLQTRSPLIKKLLLPVHPLRLLLEIFGKEKDINLTFFKLIMEDDDRQRSFLHYFSTILKEISRPMHNHNLSLHEEEFAQKIGVPLNVFQSYLGASGHDGWKHLIQTVYRRKEETRKDPPTP